MSNQNLIGNNPNPAKVQYSLVVDDSAQQTLNHQTPNFTFIPSPKRKRSPSTISTPMFGEFTNSPSISSSKKKKELVQELIIPIVEKPQKTPN
jgi:hypothetical protein